MFKESGAPKQDVADDELLSEEEREAAKQHEIALFQPHPKPDDCPICFLTLPLSEDQRTYKTCCGKTLCFACVEAMRENQMTLKHTGDICPFCKVEYKTSERGRQVQKRIELNDPKAFLSMGLMCRDETFGQKKDEEKAVEWM
jgi:hypothetical protein